MYFLYITSGVVVCFEIVKVAKTINHTLTLLLYCTYCKDSLLEETYEVCNVWVPTNACAYKRKHVRQTFKISKTHSKVMMSSSLTTVTQTGTMTFSATSSSSSVNEVVVVRCCRVDVLVVVAEGCLVVDVEVKKKGEP